MSKYLDQTGLAHFWDKIKAKIDAIDVGGRNLFLMSTIETGSDLKTDGTVEHGTSATGKTCGTSDWIVVKPDTEYALTIETDSTGANLWNRCCFYDSNKDFISIFSYDYNLAVPNRKRRIVTAPSNAAYARISARHLTATSTYPNISTKVMFEEGNKATKWTPAPEDVDADLNEAMNSTIINRVWYAECSTAAATAAKVATITPVTTDFALNKGAIVIVKFSVTNSAAVADLTLDVNGTGAKSIKRYGTTNLAAVGNLTAGQALEFVYDGTNWLFTGHVDTNSNNYDRRLHNNYIKAAAAVAKNKIACGTSAGYIAVAANAEFDIDYPLLLASAAWTSGTQYANGYEAYPSVNPATTGTVQGIAVDKMVYLKGTLTGKKFKCAASNFLTCNIPTSEDGYYYIPLGLVSHDATTKMFFNPQNILYAYRNRSFQRVDTAALALTDPPSQQGILACFGDSILAGWSNEYPNGIDAWDTYLAEALGFSSSNLFKVGIGGAGFASGSVFSGMVSTMVSNITSAGKSASDVTMVVLGGGINDIRNDKLFDAVRTGAVNFLNNALTSFPNAQIHIFPMIMGNMGCRMRLFELERAIRIACNDMTTANAGRIIFHTGCWTWNYDGNDSGVSADGIHLLPDGEKLTGTSMAIEINGGSAYNEGFTFPIVDINGNTIAYGSRRGGMVEFSIGANITTAVNTGRNVALGIDRRYLKRDGVVFMSNPNQNGTIIFFCNPTDWNLGVWSSYTALNNQGVYGNFAYYIECPV